MIPYGKQSIDDSDVEAVIQVLGSDFLTQGPAVPAFEEAVASRYGGRFAIATNSATGALHIACMALDVGPGDLVWTSPITFVASSNCALYCGARVDFVDIDPRTYNLSVSALRAKLESARTAGALPKVVIPVHLAGQACDMRTIHALSEEFGFRIIEDASHAIGGEYEGLPIGDGRYSDITVFSYHPVKIVTTAEGGMALTNDERLAQRMQRLRSHGVTRDAAQLERQPDGPWYYEQLELGYNYRLTDLQAALGLSQLRRLDPFIARRRELARRYDRAFEHTPLVRPWQHPDSNSSWHLYVIRVDATQHRSVFDRLRERGIGVNLHYIPVYLQPYYRKLGFEPGLCPEAERYYGEAISLPLFPGLDDAAQDRVVSAVSEILATP